MANSYKGKIVAIEGIQSITRDGKEPFEKRRLILDATRFDGLTGERGFEKRIIFEFNGKNVHVPDAFTKGDIVEVFFDVESYEGTKKDGTKDWFTSVRGYRMQRIGNHAQAPQPQQAAMPQGSQPTMQQGTQPQQPAPSPYNTPEMQAAERVGLPF